MPDAGVDAGPRYAPLPVLPLPAEPPPPDDPAPSPSDRLALGAETSCVMTRDGRLRCWGSNRFGQLGAPALPRGRSARREAPALVAGIEDARDVSAGTWHVCVVHADRTVSCWGHGAWGQLGDGATEDRSAPVRAAIDGVVQVAAGEGHTCVRRADRTAWCWGHNHFGQLGDGTQEDRTAPVQVPLESVVEIRTGRSHTCARTEVDEVSEVYCWGENLDAQLGDGTRSEPAGFRTTAAKVAVEAAQQLSIGAGSGCVLGGGGVTCWGRNDSYQLGARPGGHAESAILEPTPMEATADATQVAAGARHSCVLLRSSEEDVTAIRCSGLNNRGQIGDGSRSLRRDPTEVSGLGNATHIAVGGEHSCALRAAGPLVVCWGDNRRGQLGDGSRRYRTEPVPVVGSERWRPAAATTTPPGVAEAVPQPLR